MLNGERAVVLKATDLTNIALMIIATWIIAVTNCLQKNKKINFKGEKSKVHLVFVLSSFMTFIRFLHQFHIYPTCLYVEQRLNILNLSRSSKNILSFS